MQITVIIPFYNSEKTIARCAKSLFDQSLEDGIEFVFIDDYSTDNSLAILTELLEKYPHRSSQVSIIRHERNCGISFSRKEGADLAKGVFIAWCDSDDWVEPNMYEKLLSVATKNKVDIVISNMFVHEMKSQCMKVWKTHYTGTFSPKIAIKKFWTDKHIPRALLNTMIKKELIARALREIVPVNYSEDTYSILRCFYYATSVSWVDDCLYHYDMIANPSSLTSRNFATKQEWIMQKQNIDSIQNIFFSGEDKIDYVITMNYIKWWWKKQFQESFDSCWDYWRTYNECYKDICTISHTKGINKVKVILTNRLYPIFWLNNHHIWAK